MTEVNIFEQATRLDLTFQLSNGETNVSGLWKLKPTRRAGKLVDDLLEYKKQLKRKVLEAQALIDEDEDESLSPEDELDKLRLDIVVHILNTRKQEAELAKQEAAKKAHNDNIKAIMARKQTDKYEGLSFEELEGMIIK